MYVYVTKVAFVNSDPWTTAHAHAFAHALVQSLPHLASRTLQTDLFLGLLPMHLESSAALFSV